MAKLLSLFSAFVLTRCVLSQSDLSGCPDNLQSQQYARAYTDTCILFVHDEKSWDDSRKLCRNMGGDLVMLKDSQKEKFFLSSMNALRWDRNQIWIGLTDSHHEGHWQWVDGTPIAYGNFARGQGNNHNGGFLFFGGSSEDCALLRRDDGGLWHDYPCHPPIADIGYHYSYACEFPRNTSATNAPLPTTTTTTIETMAPSTAMPNVETPATTTMGNVETPAPTEQNVETPAPTAQNVETPAPTTSDPNVETPAPTKNHDNHGNHGNPHMETPPTTPISLIGRRRRR